MLAHIENLGTLHELLMRIAPENRVRGELRAELPLSTGERARFSLGHDIPLSADAIAAIKQAPGVLRFEELQLLVGTA